MKDFIFHLTSLCGAKLAAISGECEEKRFTLKISRRMEAVWIDRN